MTAEHVDVLIVGAGLSGIGAAHHLQEACPGKTYAILEAREAIGGTWDLFRYPGIRSDSDMFTLGYAFKPWKEAKAIADGPSILRYIRETAREDGSDRHIRFGHRVVRAAWSTPEARWTVEAERTDTGETVELTCGFLLLCSGYFRYDEGYTPAFAGTERFAGRIVHPQHWTDDIEYAGRRVVVIGSGATAVTLVPALAERAEHVTMLQRSPTYIVAVPDRDPVAELARRALPEHLAHPVIRWKNVALTSLVFQLSRHAPGLVRRLVRRGAERQLPADYDIGTHFTPRYDPWDQRMCIAPDGDFFRAIRSGRASVVTDEVETFTEAGIRLASGTELEADLIVTATGLQLQMLGGMDLAVDGEPVDLPEHVTYKGMMLSGVPNLAMVTGYTNASWTLKCDLTCDYVCRLLNHMDAHGHRQCTPRLPQAPLETEPIIGLTAGYVLRSIDRFPRQGRVVPWRLHQNYARDVALLRCGPLEDGAMEFSRPAAAERAEPLVA